MKTYGRVAHLEGQVENSKIKKATKKVKRKSSWYLGYNGRYIEI